MKNRTIANWLIGCYSVAVIDGLLDIGDPLTSITGLAMLVFGIMAIVRLYKIDK
jgi:hypothetical protein